MTPAPFLQRNFGDYLLVAQLSEDALGTVFRALYAADERRFVRLRILQSDEISRDALVRAIEANVARVEALVHDSIVTRPQMSVAEGVPFLTWDETAGWTLDTMLSRVRAFGIRIPAEYALLIAERIAAALEHAHRCVVDGRPTDHGALWPGFVSISHDAAVRVGGFGIASGLLPTLAAPRMTAEIAPYIAPEARAFGEAGANSDVYSLGAILVELLTGRGPALDGPTAELRAGDPRSDELAALLKRCLAPPEERFASSAEAHRAIQQIVTGNPFSLYTANLALFLYKLLNPESQSVVSASDFESTNPVLLPNAAEPDASDAASEEIASSAAAALSVILAGEEAAPEPVAPSAEDPGPAPPSPEKRAASVGAGEGLMRPEIRRPTLEQLEANLPPPPPAPGAWARAAAPLAAAAGVALAAFLVATQIQSVRSATEAGKASAPGPEPALVRIQESPPAVDAVPPARSAAHTGLPALAPAPGRAAKPVRRVQPQLRHPAEDLRLRAALARIEADRVNAREAAGDLFGEGRQSEEEGERLLQRQEYDAAQLAFSRAARLFQKAQELSWEERVRQANLSGNGR